MILVNRTVSQKRRECLALAPDDGPAKLFIERVRILRENPPPAGWNGVWHLESK